MGGRGIFRVLAVVLLVAVVAAIGVGVYNLGVDQGYREAAQLADGANGGAGDGGVRDGVRGYDGYGGHRGFGFPIFGLLFGILLIFLIFGLIRAAFGFGRWGGPPHGGPPWGYGGPSGPGGWGGRRDFLEDWHRRAHGEVPPEDPAGRQQAQPV